MKPISLEVLFLSTQTYVSLGFRLSLVSRVNSSPYANDGLGWRGGWDYACGSRLVRNRSLTPSVSRTCLMALHKWCSDSV